MTEQPQVQDARRQRILNTYEAKTTGLLSGLAFVYLFTYSAQSIWYFPDQTWWIAMTNFSLALWLLFAIDLIFRFTLAPHKRQFLKKNLFDTITVVIPQLRALRTLRAFTPGGVISKSGLVSSGAVASAVIATLLVVWVGGLMVLNAERGASGAEIKTPGEAVWWAFETITTVGYGDFVPVTALGRTFGVMVMLVGIGVVGVITAAFAAGLVKRSSAGQPAPPPNPAQEVLDKLDQLTDMVARLEARLDATPPNSSPPG